MTIHPQLVNISPEIILTIQNMLIYALFIDCCESHLRTFCCQIHQCARIFFFFFDDPSHLLVMIDELRSFKLSRS